MISEFFISLALQIATWLVNLMPDWNMPAELADPDGFLYSIFELGYGLGPWVDWGFVTALAAIPLVVWLIGFGWKSIRTLASHIPGVGGSG